jgi:hypothetical protein
MVGLDQDLLGDAPADRDRDVGRQIPDEEGAAEDPAGDDQDPVSLMESQGEQPPADALAAVDGGDSKRYIKRSLG